MISIVLPNGEVLPDPPETQDPGIEPAPYLTQN